jgi:hypothetical protein
MPRVVPSQIVELIDQLYPQAKEGTRVDARTGPTLAAIAAAAKAIPPELLTLTGGDLSDYIVVLAMIDMSQKQSLAIERPLNVPEHRGISPIVLLRQALAKCPDETPAPGTTELLFIRDVDLRESIRRDISAAAQDLSNGEWKGATVLAGSAMEALLLWALQRLEQHNAGVLGGAVSALLEDRTLSKKPDLNPERWNLIELIAVASELSVISSRTAIQARLAKDFRNLIHPGRAARLREVCDRATALSALAAVEHVVRDLTINAPSA